ncbi:MAG: hypothetical protein KDD40_08545, partial [Bdellovibrionales bacterium]|nr:hypothetical protein [Bdellovibrionales bacterium]
VFYRSGANVALNPIVSQVYPKTHKGQYLSDHFGKKVSFELTVSPSESSPIQRPVDSYTKTLLNRLLKLFKQQKSSNFDYVQNIIEKRLSELGSVNPQRIASSCDDLLQPAF